LADCDQILADQSPPGSFLIEAASILRDGRADRFDSRLRELVTPEDGETSEAHRALAELTPRGYLTFNYDDAHENAVGLTTMVLPPLVPSDEKGLRGVLQTRFAQPFLLKAHGSLHSPEPLVLSYESYRDLFVRQPAYRAFVQSLLTNFHLLIVGFGLSDPDFDLFVGSMASQFGSPLHEHVVIRHSTHDRSAQEIELRRRYGIHTLYVDDYPHIPKLLRSAALAAGPRLRPTLEVAVRGASNHERASAHQALRALGPAGRRAILAELLQMLASERDPHYVSEIAYTLGKVDARASKRTLIDIVDDPSPDPAPKARALTVLREVLEPADVPLIERWRQRFRKQFIDPNERGYRLVVYADYLAVYVPAKFNSEHSG
jgi:hypothetical protein